MWLCTLLLVLQTRDLQVVCYAFTAFGKAAIKQRKLHPDTFVQLAMQLAYYRLHKKYGLTNTTTQEWCLKTKKRINLMSLLTALRPGSCYETAMTRKFYHGRTETMRPCTKEAVDWCAVMTDPASNVSVCLSGTVHFGRIAEEKGGGKSLWILEH